MESSKVMHHFQALNHVLQAVKRLELVGKLNKYRKALMVQQISQIQSRLNDIFTMLIFSKFFNKTANNTETKHPILRLQ